MGKGLPNKKILFFTIGQEGLASTRIRVYGHLPYLREAGFDCRLISYTLAYYQRLFTQGKRGLFISMINKLYGWLAVLRLLLSAYRHDMVFIQRVLLPKAAFDLLRRLNSNIVFDFDDGVYLVRPKQLSHILRYARCIITTQSRSNRDFALSVNDNVFSLTSPVDTQRYLPGVKQTDKQEVVIGWIGSPETAQYLLRIAGPLRALSAKYAHLKIILVGAGSFAIAGVQNLEVKEWRLRSEVEDLRSFDIGIMPLSDDEWARNKYYKLVQYFAMGIPVVSSAVGVCNDIVRDGVNGFLVKGDEQWMQRLSLLIENTSLRQEIGRQARLAAENTYSYTRNSPYLAGILHKLCA